MSCLIAPASAAIVVIAFRKKVPKEYHIEWLNLMLWGGVLMSVVDHIMNGEIIASFPFFTGSNSQIIREIWTIGLPITVTVFIAWFIMIAISQTFFRPKTEQPRC